MDRGPSQHTPLIEEYMGYPFVDDSKRLFSSPLAVDEVSRFLPGFDEFSLALVKESAERLKIGSFVIRANAAMPPGGIEREHPWDAAVELAKITRPNPVLADLGGGYIFVFPDSSRQSVAAEGRRFRETIDRQKEYREVNPGEALSSPSILRAIERDYRLNEDDLRRINARLQGASFVAASISTGIQLKWATEYLIESRDRLGKPVVARFNDTLLIGDFEADAAALENTFKLQCAQGLELAELRTDLMLQEFRELDLSEPDGVVAWFLRAEKNDVYFLDDAANEIREALMQQGFDGEVPEEFTSLPTSAAQTAFLKKMDENEFRSFIINVGLSGLEELGAGGRLLTLIEARTK